MTGISDLSDAQLEALANDDHEAFTAATATAHGVRPELALAVRSQESRGRQDAVSPKGARGQMQLMPGTAKQLGVDANDPYQNIEGGVRYLGQQISDFGDEDLGLAAYNAGPGAVRKYGDVPPYKETQDYVTGVRSRDISQASDEDLMRIAGEADAAPPEVTAQVEGRPDLGVGVAHADAARPKPRGALPQLPQRQAAAQDPTIAQDALSGALQPFQDVGHTFMEGYRQSSRGEGLDPTFIPRLLGGAAAAIPTAIQMAAARPSARGINKGAAKIGLQPHAFTWDYRNPYRKLEGDEAQRQTEGQLVTAMSAGRPSAGKLPAAPKARTASVQDLQVAKTDAYNHAKALGVSYDPKATAKLGGEIQADLKSVRINPNITPKAHAAMLEVSDALSGGKPVDLEEVDQLRQLVHLATGKADDAEKFMGKRIIDAIDRFTDSAGPSQVVNGSGPEAAAAITAAREANKRFRKVQTVTNEVESAKLRASSTYAGGNQANATRQELRPLIDPTSGKRIQNLTPKETRAVKRVVNGSGGANAWRVIGKTLDPRGLLGAAVQAAGAAKTAGLSAASIPLGMAASSMSNRATNKAVADLLHLLAGPAPKGAKLPPIALPQLGPTTGMVKLLSPKGAAGVASIAGLPARLPARPSEQKAASRAKVAQRK